MFVQMRGNFLDAVRHAIWRVLRAGLLGAFFGGVFVEILGAAVDGGWPGRLFVHFAALVVAALAGYAVGVTAAIFVGVRGMMTAADNLEDAARQATAGGFRMMDDIVDSVDGGQRRKQP
ncbi:MAG TPA: hypothetical protein VJN88_09140 [Ktedonobacterales bacterium]|nr:hypothetical protein [Ktedonobacterales bacterium]